MKKIFTVVTMFLMVIIFSGCAMSSGEKQSYNFAKGPADLPPSAKVDVIRYTEKGTAIIGVKGVTVMHVEIYGRDIENAKLQIEGEWCTFELPKGRWFNFRFNVPGTSEYAFAYVTKEDADMPQAWMGKDITTYQPPGWGAAMTVRGFVRR